MRSLKCVVLLFTVFSLVTISSAQQTSTTAVPIYRQQDGGAPIWLETQNVTFRRTSESASSLSVGKTTPGDSQGCMPAGGLSVLVDARVRGTVSSKLVGAPYAGVQHRVSISILCPLVRPKKAIEPRVSDRIMVGTFSQRYACEASGAEGVEHHRIMKPSSGNHQLGVVLREYAASPRRQHQNPSQD